MTIVFLLLYNTIISLKLIFSTIVKLRKPIYSVGYWWKVGTDVCQVLYFSRSLFHQINNSVYDGNLQYANYTAR